MKNKKTLIAFLLLILLIGAFLAVTYYTSILSYMEISSQADLKVRGMVDTLNRVQDHLSVLETEFREKTENTMEMMSIALRPFVKEDTYYGPDIFMDKAVNGNVDGIVIRSDNGNVIYPEGFSGRFEPQGEDTEFTHLPVMSSAVFVDKSGNTRPVLLSIRQIEGDFYYVDWWEMEEYQASINYEKNIGEAISALEKLYEAKLLLFWKPEEDSPINNIEILYASESLGAPESIDVLGITKEDLSSESPKLTIGKNIYAATYEELQIFDRAAKAIVLLNPISNNTYVFNCVIIAAGSMLICISALILWLHWIEDYAQSHDLTEAQKNSWQPYQLRRRTMAIDE